MLTISRFLRMATDSSDTNRTITFADPPASANFVSEKVPIRALNQEVMDVAFVKAVGYYPQGTDVLMRDHRFDDAVALGKHWAYKYLLDLDGMSYSGRFMGFLASDSVPMKATVYQEYFSDWIQPWYVLLPVFVSAGLSICLCCLGCTTSRSQHRTRRYTTSMRTSPVRLRLR